MPLEGQRAPAICHPRVTAVHVTRAVFPKPACYCGTRANDVVVATASSGERRCGNDVVGRAAGGGSGGNGDGRGAAVPGEGLMLGAEEARPWAIVPTGAGRGAAGRAP